jgi:hypothetical protein
VKPLVLSALTAFVTAALAVSAFGQEGAAVGEPQTAAAGPPESIDTITVRGQRIGKLLGELRHRVEIAEEAVFARFNDINSTDDFDIHCGAESREGTRTRERNCQSNSWKEQQGEIGTLVARAFQGQANVGLAQLYAQEQLRMQRLLEEEMRQLAAEDEQLDEAIAKLEKAQFAVVLVHGKRTLMRKVDAVGDETHGAERVFEVIMGVDWTVPNTWSSCVLRVAAKKGATFRLYEF